MAAARALGLAAEAAVRGGAGRHQLDPAHKGIGFQLLELFLKVHPFQSFWFWGVFNCANPRLYTAAALNDLPPSYRVFYGNVVGA